MTDRELLEAAAKAAGLLTRSDSTSVWIVEDDGSPLRRWLPLSDDGDALRLAVALQLSPLVYRREQRSSCVVPIDGVKSPQEAWVDGDALAATRRAIVRAAAAMAGRGRIGAA